MSALFLVSSYQCRKLDGDRSHVIQCHVYVTNMATVRIYIYIEFSSVSTFVAFIALILTVSIWNRRNPQYRAPILENNYVNKFDASIDDYHDFNSADDYDKFSPSHAFDLWQEFYQGMAEDELENCENYIDGKD